MYSGLTLNYKNKKIMELKDYVDAGKRASEWHKENINKIKQRRFDSIAVHGVYSMQGSFGF